MSVIKVWSFSALQEYRKCPYRLKLKTSHGKTIPKTEALLHGEQAHKDAEDFVKGTVAKLPRTLNKLKEAFENLRQTYLEQPMQVEELWGFDMDWGSVTWDAENAWCRIKLDVGFHTTPTSYKVIDYKTGRGDGNVKHWQQCQLYALAAFLKYPELELVEVALWYLDAGIIRKKQYSREDAMHHLNNWYKAGLSMTLDEELKPTPSQMNCMYCDYDAVCEYGVNV